METNFSGIAGNVLQPSVNSNIQGLPEQQKEGENVAKLAAEAKVLPLSADNNEQQEQNSNLETDLPI